MYKLAGENGVYINFEISVSVSNDAIGVLFSRSNEKICESVNLLMEVSKLISRIKKYV